MVFRSAFVLAVSLLSFATINDAEADCFACRCEVSGGVRHQSFRDSEQGKLREALARLVDDVTRLAVGAASGVGRWCGV
jgi:hypothetical protein